MQVARITSIGPNDMDFQVAKVSSSVNSISKRIIAEKDMILSSKVFRTPHIHLYSGISDRKELEAVGITTIIGNPNMKKNIY